MSDLVATAMPDDDSGRPTDSCGQSGAPPKGPGEALDPFDIDRLRLPQDLSAAAGVQRLITVVPIDRPPGESFFRVRPGDENMLTAAILELKAEREKFLVLPELYPHLVGEPTVTPRLIATTITRQGAIGLWPVKLPKADGRLDAWSESAMAGAMAARTRWVRPITNMAADMYDVRLAPEDLPDPDWPAINLNDLIRIGFKERVIDRLGHPILRRLWGEIG